MVEASKGFIRVLLDGDLQESLAPIQQLGVRGFPTVLFLDVRDRSDVKITPLKDRSPDAVLSQMRAHAGGAGFLKWALILALAGALGYGVRWAIRFVNGP